VSEPQCVIVDLTQAHKRDNERDVSLMAIDQYFREVRWTPDLTREEEAQLIEWVRRGLVECRQPVPNQRWLQRAAQARARLVAGYQRLIVSIANDYCEVGSRCGLELLDLVNEGSMGLLAVLERLDEYGLLEERSLARLASTCIRGRLLHVLRDAGLVRLHWRAQERVKALEQVEYRLFLAFGREPTYQEIASEMGVSVEQVCEVRGWLWCWRVTSMDALFDGVETDGSPDACLDLVSVFGGGSANDDVRWTQLVEVVQRAMAKVLTPRQREILGLRYGLGQEVSEVCTQEEAAVRLGVSGRFVRRCEGEAKERLQAVLAPYAKGSGVAA
jgi:DNA-directed RNA polymerase sigma subunit (sigma70/sigma32)